MYWRDWIGISKSIAHHILDEPRIVNRFHAETVQGAADPTLRSQRPFVGPLPVQDGTHAPSPTSRTETLKRSIRLPDFSAITDTSGLPV